MEYLVRGQYPVAKAIEAPASIPPGSERTFLQAEANAKAKNFDAAGAMYRKAIDIATRALDANLAGKKLATRIDALHAAGRLTNDLAEWAHQVRLDGNQGAHDDEELTEEQVSQLGSFAELFLTYTFTLPAMVRARKGEIENAAGAPDAD